MKWLFRLISIILFAFFFGLAIKNTQEVTIFFFFDYEITQSLVLILLCFFIMGGILTYLLLIPNTLRDKLELSRQKKRIFELEEEYEALKQVIQKQASVPEEKVESKTPSEEDKTIHNETNIT